MTPSNRMDINDARSIGARSVVLTVATGARYVKGQHRLTASMNSMGQFCVKWDNALPPGCPPHRERPYAFKSYAIQWAMSRGFTRIMWCDASIVPIRPLAPIWEHAAEHGAWLSNNGFTNYEWTADSAYPDLFPEYFVPGAEPAVAREVNKLIKHVVGGVIAIDLNRPNGVLFAEEYVRLGTQTKAFCGPWSNIMHTDAQGGGGDYFGACGPADVRGHRHDQTALSVIAWRLGIPLTDPPKYFCYRGGESHETILVADGDF